MRTASIARIVSLHALAWLAACGTDSTRLPSQPGQASRILANRLASNRSAWSEPVNLGAPINSAGDEFNATLSPDGLSIYFNSDRTDVPGAQGGNDIWIARRACRHCPWGTPVNPGPPLNSPAGEGNVSFSNDGRMMFFNSTRPGGFGRADIYVSHRSDPDDDFGWELPVNLGPGVNTPDMEGGPAYLQKTGTLYFNRGVIAEQKADIYAAQVTRSGVTLGPAVAVVELNDPTLNDGNSTVRQDGKELIFWSNRGSPPDRVRGDLFVSTRRSIHEPWSTPVNLGAPVNTESDEIAARLSRDGRTLLITSSRPGGLGGTQFGFDIWMSTRTLGDDLDDDDEDDGRDIDVRQLASAWSPWSEPVNLGAPVNSACNEQTPTLSRDQLALYFTSNRRGGFGQDTPDGCQNTTDLWVSRRASRDRPWQTPVNLGPGVNTSANEGGANLSPDGHLLFFHSTRPGPGQFDIYLSRRTDTDDDLAWGPPTLVGPGVNTAAFELAPDYVQIAERGEGDEDEEQDDGAATLYFHGGLDNGNNADIYAVPVTRRGEARGSVRLISELSAPNFPDGFPSVRRDGKEIFFSSGRPGGVSQFDLWTSTRASVDDPWSPPVNLGRPVNTEFGEFQPDLSFDGRTLVFMAGGGRGGVGGFDIWMSTRTAIDDHGHGEVEDGDPDQSSRRDVERHR